MKKHFFRFYVTIFSILLFFCWTALRGIELYSEYPDPKIQTYLYGETAQSGSYQITFDGWQWGNESLVNIKFPDYVLIHGGSDEESNGVRVGLISFTIEKISEGKDAFDISNIGFSSGALGNQFDMDLFYLLNPGMDDMILQLTVGQTQQITLPLIALESQFTAAQWADIDSRNFYINLQYYPEHIRFLCPCR